MHTYSTFETITDSQGNMRDARASYVPVDSPAGIRATHGETVQITERNGLTHTLSISVPGVTVEQVQSIIDAENARIANEQAHREWEDAEAEYARSIR